MATGKLTLIILADSDRSELTVHAGEKMRALIPLHGKPLIDWVIDSFRSDPRIGEIIVVGDEELDRCASMRHVSQRVPGGNGFMQSVLAMISLFREMIQPESPDHQGYIVVSADSALISPELAQQTITEILETNSDFHFYCVEKKSFVKKKLRIDRSWSTIEQKHYAVGSVIYLRRFSYISSLFELFGELITGGKLFPSVLKPLGLESKSFQEITQKMSSRINGTFHITHSEHAELASPIESLEDLTRAEKQIPSPWKKRFTRGAIIFNPHSGSGFQLSPILLHIMGIKKRRGSEWENRSELMEHAQRYLNELGVEVELCPTTHAGHATEMARTFAQKGYDLIIAAGGDGTINEVINGMAESSAALGVIPMGTANVFALELNLPVEINAACQVIASGDKVNIDLGKAGDRYFSCMAGTGFDAHVIRKADSGFKKILGILSYPLVATAEFITYPFRKITVKIDDQPIPRKGYWVVVNNGKYYGGKLSLATFADMNDGYLDVTIFKYRGIFPALIYILGMWHNRVDKLMSVEQFQCKRILIEKGHGVAVHVDAEYLCQAPIEITVVPNGLTVIR